LGVAPKESALKRTNEILFIHKTNNVNTTPTTHMHVAAKSHTDGRRLRCLIDSGDAA
jgi:hypothetical protein